LIVTETVFCDLPQGSSVSAVLAGALVKLLVGTVTAVAFPKLIFSLVWEEQLYIRGLLALLEDTT
jgi:high-affinity Fe2+/Pb2+ permease